MQVTKFIVADLPADLFRDPAHISVYRDQCRATLFREAGNPLISCSGDQKLSMMDHRMAGCPEWLCNPVRHAFVQQNGEYAGRNTQAATL